MQKLIQLLAEEPVIAAVKNESELNRAIHSPCHVIFLLYGDICTLSENIALLKKHQKTVMVHVDLIEGLENKSIAVEYIKKATNADGIISTKPNLIKTAKDLDLAAVQRFFVIDSLAFQNIKKHMESGKADFIEILPGVMPKVIKKIVNTVSVPVIAGGLISDKEDIISALGAGAAAVSTTLPQLWEEE